MADYSIATQVQPFQAPNLLALAAQGQQMQTNALKAQLLQQEATREVQQRQVFARPDFDPTSPQGIRELGFYGGPELALKAQTAARQNENLQRQTQVSMADLALKNRDLIAKHGEGFQNSLRMVDAYPAEQRPAVYASLIGQLPPELRAIYPGQYSPAAVARGMRTTTQLIQDAAPKDLVRGKVGETDVVYDPTDPTRAFETTVVPAPKPGEVTTFPYRGAADTQERQARLGLTVTPIDQNAAQASVTGARPVNALAPAATAAAPSPYGGLNAMVAPQPGAAVPSSQLAQQQKDAETQRQLALEMAKKRQAAQIAREETTKNKLPQVEETATETLRQIDDLIGGGTVDDKGRLIYAKGAKPAHPGFGSAVGMSFSKLTGGPIPGSDRSDFEERLKQVQGGAFLDAYNMLRGGGAIDQKEGQKATAARTRMSLNQSGPEFVKAAREYADIIKSGLARARKMVQDGTWRGPEMASPAGAPTAAAGKTELSVDELLKKYAP